MIFFDHHITENENIIRFTADENGEMQGECILNLCGNQAEVTFMSYSKDMTYIGEGLIRAAFNFAANKGFYIGKCSCDDADVLGKMNFEKKDGLYINDIPSILMGKCSCKSQET